MRIDVFAKKKTRKCYDYWRLLWEVTTNGTGTPVIEARDAGGDHIHFILEADNLSELMDKVISTQKD